MSSNLVGCTIFLSSFSVNESRPADFLRAVKVGAALSGGGSAGRRESAREHVVGGELLDRAEAFKRFPVDRVGIAYHQKSAGLVLDLLTVELQQVEHRRILQLPVGLFAVVQRQPQLPVVVRQ